MDWSGHGDSASPPGDFGYARLVADALAVIRESGVRRVVPVAQAHGGWAAVALRRELGERVSKIVATSWLVLDPPPPFVGVLQALQDRERWQQAREQLFTMWVAGAPTELADRVRHEMGAYGFEMWARAGREIGMEYAQHGSPLRALAQLYPRPEFLHVFSQPRAADFLAAQQGFSRDNPWFLARRLDAVSHFPPLEVPEATAAEIERFVG
jgi:pimeloyl-ACP methyl ester carboxylesterase